VLTENNELGLPRQARARYALDKPCRWSFVGKA